MSAVKIGDRCRLVRPSKIATGRFYPYDGRMGLMHQCFEQKWWGTVYCLADEAGTYRVGVQFDKGGRYHIYRDALEFVPPPKPGCMAFKVFEGKDPPYIISLGKPRTMTKVAIAEAVFDKKGLKCKGTASRIITVFNRKQVLLLDITVPAAVLPRPAKVAVRGRTRRG